MISTLIFGTLVQIANTISMGLWLIAALMFLRYCLMIVDTTARGHNFAPSHGFFENDPRIYKQMLVALFAISAHMATPVDYRFMTDFLLFLVTPAVCTFVTFGVPLIKAIDPRNIFSFIVNLGTLRYTMFRFISISALILIFYIVDGQFTLLDTANGAYFTAGFACLLLMAVCRISGLLFHYRSEELGISTDFSQQKLSEQQYEEQQNELEELGNRISKLARGGQYKDAYSLIDQHLKRDGYTTEERLYRVLRQIQDYRPAQHLARGLIGRLIEKNQPMAWEIFNELMGESRGTFRFASGAVTIAFVASANNDDQRKKALALLTDFETVFPNHPRTREALLKAAILSCELQEFEAAREYLKKVTAHTGKIDQQSYEWCVNVINEQQI